MFNYNIELFMQAINKTINAYKWLYSKQNDINNVLNISEDYEGKPLDEEAALNLKALIPQFEELLGNMAKTLSIMAPSFSSSSFMSSSMQLVPLSMQQLQIDVPLGHDINNYWTGNEMSNNYLTICNIVGGSKQGQDQCLATARTYAQLVCQYLGIESKDEDVKNGKVGYVFDTEEDALNYIKSEIVAGYPVTLEVSNGNKKHFVMAYAIKLDENSSNIPEKISEADILYLDPVAGEVKALDTSWDEYELMARQLIHDDDVDPVNSTPLGVHGYWVGTFSGNEPQHYKNKTYAGYQDDPSNDVNAKSNSNKGQKPKDKWANPYAPFDYYVSITLSDGTIINNRDFSQEELANNNYTSPQSQLPNNLPWIKPSETSNNWYSHLNNGNYQEI